MNIFRRASLVFIAVLVICWTSREGRCYTNSSTIDRVISALFDDIQFMYERPLQMNKDAIFGVTLTEVHATAALEHKNVNYLSIENRGMLKNIVKLCEIIRADGKDLVRASEMDVLFQPKTWKRRIPWIREAFGRKRMSPGLTPDKASSLIFQGSPTEAESDKCLKELTAGGNESSAGCFVSKDCEKMIFRNDTYRGYPLTHRLLYVQVSILLNCNRGFEDIFDDLKKEFCAAIFQDLIDLSATNFPFPSRDLAMEQIVLCGIEGYMDFVNSQYADLIVSWANPHGCFSADRYGTREIRREKRSSSPMDYGCDNHASGVAAASLSLFIRAAVENHVN